MVLVYRDRISIYAEYYDSISILVLVYMGSISILWIGLIFMEGIMDRCIYGHI